MREALGSALEARRAFDDARVLDLFAGTGAFSFEALSRGALRAVVVDRDPRAIQQLTESAKGLGLTEALRISRVDLLGDPRSAVGKLPETENGFTLVFADAPYAQIGSIPMLLDALANSGRLSPGAWIVVEHPTTHDWLWPNGLASEADYRYGQTGISLGVYAPEKGTQ